MDSFSEKLYKLFAVDLHESFLKAGFTVVIEPFIDITLFGFKSTYLKNQLLYKPTRYSDGVQKSFVHVTGLPVGITGNKMIVLARIQLHPDTTCMQEVLKMKVNFEGTGLPSLSCSPSTSHHKETCLDIDLDRFILNILECLSPGLIQLPAELKLEILKKMSIQSIMEMSKVNSEFRRLIYYEDTLWRHLCRRDFKLTIINRKVHATWQELYKDRYIKYLAQLVQNGRALPPAPIIPALPPAPNRLPIAWIQEELEPIFHIEGVEDVVDHRINQVDVYERRRSIESLDNIIL